MQRSSRWSAVRVVSTLACVIAVLSCDTPLETETDGVERVVLTPTAADIQAGVTVTLTALVLDAQGNAMRERKVVWASEDASIATVSQSGVVTGVVAGTVQIAASSGGKSANATITVSPRPVSLVRITPGSATIPVTGSTTLQVEALDASGARVVGRPVAWSSSNETVAVVSSNGVVAGIAEGSVTITATIDSRSGTAAITVAPQPVASVTLNPTGATTIVGRRVTFRATPLDGVGNPLGGRTTVWTSSNPIIATVSSAGEVLGLAVGNAQIRATIEGKFAEATILVDPVPVARVVSNPGSITLLPGQTSQLTVTLTDSAGNILTGRSITYSTSDPLIATVSNTGLITAVAEGSASIQSTSEGRIATTVVKVEPVPVASIQITPSSVSLGIGQKTQLAAQAFDGQNRPLANRKFTWASGAPTVASVNSQTGEVTAVAGGSAVIFAGTEGVLASATVSVNASVQTIVVTPSTPTLSVGQQIGMTATFRDVNGIILTGRTASWASSNPSVASVNPVSGVVTAVAPGTTTISASSEGKSGTTLVTVSNLPVANVTVTPSAQNMFPGDVVTLTATARDANGNVMPGRPVSWVSSNSAVAAVNGVTGQVTAVAQGTANITATIDQVTGNALVSVNATPVASVSLTPTSTSLFAGQQTSFTATARDAAGNVISRPITWSTTNPTVIINVTQAGVVTGINPGTEGVIAMAVGAGVGGSSVGDTATVTVSLVPVASISISPSPVAIFTGQQVPLAVQLRDSNGGPLGTAGRTINWSSLNPAVASVTANGLLNGVAPGATQVVVSTPGATGAVADTASVTVSASPVVSIQVQPKPNTVYQGATKSLRAVVLNAGGPPPVRGRNVSWVARPAGIVAVSQVAATPDSATYTTITLGTTYIVAEDPSGLRDSTLVSALPVPVTSVLVTPASATVNLGDSTQLTALARDSADNALARPITWMSSAPGVASVSSTGMVTAVAGGTASIIAQATGAGVGGANVSGTSFITAHLAVNSVGVTSARPFVVPNDTVHLGVILRDFNNNVITGRPITFVSGDPAIATVNAAGVVTGIGVGPVTITATSEGKNGTVALTGLSPVTGIAVAGPGGATDTLVTVAGTKVLTLSVSGGAGSYTLAVTTSNAGVATVSASSVTTSLSGVASVTVTGVAAGPVTITFTAVRQGAVPPGTPGNNIVSGSIQLRVQ